MEYIAERDRWSASVGFRTDGTPLQQSDEELQVTLKDTQQFVVFQAAHAETVIQSHDGKPWIRIVGFSPSLNAARQLARRAHDEGGGVETRIMPTGKNFLIGRVKYNGLDLDRRAEEQTKSNRMVDDAIASRKQRNVDVQAAAEAKAQTHTASETSDAVAVTEAPSPSALDNIADFPSHARIGGLVPATKPTPTPQLQRFCALAVIPDPDHEMCEPSVIALYAYEDESDMRDAVTRSSKTAELIHFDVFVGPTGVWLPLTQTVAEKIIHHNPLRQNLEDNLKFEGGSRVVAS